MTLHNFYMTVNDMSANYHWRIGQALFNHLLTIRPDLAERIRGSSIDPFQCTDTTDMRYEGATYYIERNWEIMSSDGDLHTIEQSLNNLYAANILP